MPLMGDGRPVRGVFYLLVLLLAVVALQAVVVSPAAIPRPPKSPAIPEKDPAPSEQLRPVRKIIPEKDPEPKEKLRPERKPPSGGGAGDPGKGNVGPERKAPSGVGDNDPGEGNLGPERKAPSGGEGDDPGEGNLGFLHGFAASLSVVVVSELGDRTFFIAAIMAMSYNRLTVLAGTLLALGLMTCLSVLLGYATVIVPRIYTYYVSTALFAVFGVRMLREGLRMSADEGQEELAEVQAEIRRKDKALRGNVHSDGAGVEAGGFARAAPPRGNEWYSCVSPVFLQAFTLTFLAEWGDRSQLTTIMLAATEHPLGVAVGGTLGHGLCTGLAVVGGRMVATKISTRTVTIIGGILFLVFAISSVFIKPDFDTGFGR